MKFIFLLMVIGAVFLAACTSESIPPDPLPPEPVGCPEDARICADGTTVVRIPPDCDFEECPVVDTEKHFCDSPRKTACTKESNPSCGWFDPAQIVCVKYPCAANYGNPCTACADEKVLYWTQGKCPLN